MKKWHIQHNPAFFTVSDFCIHTVHLGYSLSFYCSDSSCTSGPGQRTILSCRRTILYRNYSCFHGGTRWDVRV